VDSACLQVFLDAFGRQAGDRRAGLVLDGSGAHAAKVLAWPENLAPVRLPPYSPELNPAEKVFHRLRARLANRLFEDRGELEAALTAEPQAFWDDHAVLQQLTGFGRWLDGLQRILPSAA
jgi:transposase